MTNKDLLSRAIEIRDENVTAANTAHRVGDAFVEVDNLIKGIKALGYMYVGMATPSTDPGKPLGKVFYIANTPGTYSHFAKDMKLENGVYFIANIAMKDELPTWKAELLIPFEIQRQTETAVAEIQSLQNDVISNFNAQTVTPQMLSPETMQLINASGSGTIVNHADGEDLTVTPSNTIQLANKAYDKANHSGLGRVYLRKNIQSVGDVKKNVLTQAMLPSENTIYIIQYDFDLNGAGLDDPKNAIKVPANCVLKFEGGLIRGGLLDFNNCIIKGTPKLYVECLGFCRNPYVIIDWFIENDDWKGFERALKVSNEVHLLNRTYNIDKYIVVRRYKRILSHNTDNDTVISFTPNSPYTYQKKVYYPCFLLTDDNLVDHVLLHGFKIQCTDEIIFDEVLDFPNRHPILDNGGKYTIGIFLANPRGASKCTFSELQVKKFKNGFKSIGAIWIINLIHIPFHKNECNVDFGDASEKTTLFFKGCTSEGSVMWLKLKNAGYSTMINCSSDYTNWGSLSPATDIYLGCPAETAYMFDIVGSTLTLIECAFEHCAARLLNVCTSRVYFMHYYGYDLKNYEPAKTGVVALVRIYDEGITDITFDTLRLNDSVAKSGLHYFITFQHSPLHTVNIKGNLFDLPIYFLPEYTTLYNIHLQDGTVARYSEPHINYDQLISGPGNTNLMDYNKIPLDVSNIVTKSDNDAPLKAGNLPVYDAGTNSYKFATTGWAESIVYVWKLCKVPRGRNIQVYLNADYHDTYNFHTRLCFVDKNLNKVKVKKVIKYDVGGQVKSGEVLVDQGVCLSRDHKVYLFNETNNTGEEVYLAFYIKMYSGEDSGKQTGGITTTTFKDLEILVSKSSKNLGASCNLSYLGDDLVLYNETTQEWDKILKNPIGLATEGNVRPENAPDGYQFFDTHISPNRYIWKHGNQWIDANGSVVQ